MKQLFIAAIMLLLYFGASAQSTSSLNEQLRHVFAPLDKSEAKTGYLVNQQLAFANFLKN
jgi:hypothetical protein